MLGGSVWVWVESDLFRLVEGQTHFSTSWHAKMSLTLTEPIQSVLCSNLHTTSKHALETYQTWKVNYANQPVLTKSHVELEEILMDERFGSEW